MFTNNTRKRIDAVTGNTALHYAVSNCKYFKEFKASIAEIDNHILSNMAKCNNNKNELPIEIIQEREDINDTLRNKIFNFLLPYTLPTNYKKLSESLNREKILNRYQGLLCSEKFKILEIAYEITEMVRKNIKYSATHPQSNQYSIEKLETIGSKIKEMRQKSDLEVKKIKDYYLSLIKQAKNKVIEQKLTMELYTQTLKIYYESVIDLEMGDCSECSLIGCYYAHTIYGLKAAVRSLKNGDHVWIELEDKIYCDIWMGKIFLKDEWGYLQSHKTILAPSGTVYNILSPINYHFQFITSDLFYPIRPTSLKMKSSPTKFLAEKKAENNSGYHAKRVHFSIM